MKPAIKDNQVKSKTAFYIPKLVSRRDVFAFPSRFLVCQPVQILVSLLVLYLTFFHASLSVTLEIRPFLDLRSDDIGGCISGARQLGQEGLCLTHEFQSKMQDVFIQASCVTVGVSSSICSWHILHSASRIPGP